MPSYGGGYGPFEDDESWREGPDDDWSLDDGLDPDGPSAEDLDRFGDELDTCPACGGTVYDQADICPHCGSRMSAEPRPLGWFLVAGVVIVLALIVGWYVW